MYWKFIYNEKTPNYNSYINLLKKLENNSNEFYELDKIFYDSYNYKKLIEYEKAKKKKVLEMFKIIIEKYYYYKYLISRIEIWSINYNHHFEHRSKETVTKGIINKEYYDLWNNNYDVIEEQINTFDNMNSEIIKLLYSIKNSIVIKN